MRENFPELSFPYYEKEVKLAHQIYMGFFLALAIFLGYIFGNFFLSLMISICALFIIFGSEREVGEKVFTINEDGIYIDQTFIDFESIKYFYFIDIKGANLDGLIRISFKDNITPNFYIRLNKQMQKENIYAIMSARQNESPNKITLIEVLFIKLFV